MDTFQIPYVSKKILQKYGALGHSSFNIFILIQLELL